MTLTELKDRRETCPGCGADWGQLKDDLNSPQEWVSYPNASATGFMGKSNARIKAETIISKCSLCMEHFSWIKGGD